MELDELVESLNSYEKALFDAFVWTQVIENEVHDLILDCADDGRLNLGENERGKLVGFTLGRLIKVLRPCLEDGLYNRLEELTRMRNDVVHRSTYLQNLMNYKWLDDNENIHAEIERLRKVTTCAVGVYDDVESLFDLTDQREMVRDESLQ